MEGKASITIVENDPYVVKGGVPLSEDAIVAVPEKVAIWSTTA